MRVRRVIGAAVATAAVAVAVFGFFFFRDNFFTHYPVKAVSAPVFRSFSIPWWNFYDGGGQPLAGNPNTLTFYPDNLLYLFLPAHVAFNLHFLIHWIAAWFAMRALCRATGASPFAANFGATMYAMSGVAISALAFYNLVTAIALIPLALFAVETGSLPLLAIAFGLIGLAGEPVIAISTGIAVVMACWRKWRKIAIAVVAAIVIVSPQLVAYAEIAGEVERSVRFSTTATLAASLWPRRILELVIGPILGFLTEPGNAEFRQRLFSTIFLGVLVVPAIVLARRWRYVAIAGVMLFFALGRFNPIVTAAVDAVPRLRIARYPEKFAIALVVALVVLVAATIDRLGPKWRIACVVITFAPLAYVVARGTPLDWFGPYRTPRFAPQRICGGEPSGVATRADYRALARTFPPIFGAVAGLRYGANRSPEGMHSLMSRIVVERMGATRRAQYLRICGCGNVPASLPAAWIVPRVVPVHSVNDEVRIIESGRFDEHTAALAPASLANFVSPPNAKITRYAEGQQAIAIDVTTPANALLFVNQSFFRAWSARTGGRELSTLPLDIDRLGIVVPAGRHTIELRFGRHHLAVAIAWLVSSALLVACMFVEIRDRRTREVERAGDEDRPRT